MRSPLPQNFDYLLFNQIPGSARRVLPLPKDFTIPLDLVADLIAVGLFYDCENSTREGIRVGLTTCGHAAIEAFFKTDTRIVDGVSDGDELLTFTRELAALGIDPKRFTRSCVRGIAVEAGRPTIKLQTALHAALAYPGDEEALFAFLPEWSWVFLPPLTGTLPPGLSKLTELTRLRLEGSLTSSKNVGELAAIPNQFNLELWVKNADLSLLDAAAENIGGLSLRGALSGLSDITPLRTWKNLRELDLSGTDVTDLSALEGLGLAWLSIRDLKVTDFSVLKRIPELHSLAARGVTAHDLSDIFALSALAYLELGAACPRDLTCLAPMTGLRQLELWGVAVDSLDPLVGLPLTALTLNDAPLPDLSPLARIPTLKTLNLVGARADAPGLDAVRAAHPDLKLVL